MFPVYLRKLIPGYVYGGTRSGSASERTLLATREKDTVNWNGNREIYQSACKRRMHETLTLDCFAIGCRSLMALCEDYSASSISARFAPQYLREDSSSRL